MSKHAAPGWMQRSGSKQQWPTRGVDEQKDRTAPSAEFATATKEEGNDCRCAGSHECRGQSQISIDQFAISGRSVPSASSVMPTKHGGSRVPAASLVASATAD